MRLILPVAANKLVYINGDFKATFQMNSQGKKNKRCKIYSSIPKCMCLCASVHTVYLIPVLLTDSSLFGFGTGGSEYLFQLVFLKKVGHLTRVQHIVDILQKLLHHNLQKDRRSAVYRDLHVCYQSGPFITHTWLSVKRNTISFPSTPAIL